MKYHLPLDIALCKRDDCPLHMECARWLDKLPSESYWYSYFDPENCEDFIEKKQIESKKKKK